MKNDNKSDYTIKFARKAINFLAKRTRRKEFNSATGKDKLRD
jgi:hypothetical protein